jgi:pilus assembly protein CpaC
LLCRSGKEAEFMAGGEFPVKVSSFRSSEVVWKSYGIRLHVKPLADVSGRMSIAIETEVSELDESHKTDDQIPGLFTNKMQTHFDLTRSRTIALSGLIKSGQSRHSSGLPGLSSLPILGPLFSSQEFKDEQSELVIFVTPEVMKADDDALEKNP